MRKIILYGLLTLLPLTGFAQTYGDDFLTGGECSANQEYSGSYVCEYAVDDNLGTSWLAEPGSLPNWFQYDLGTSTSKILAKAEIDPVYDAGGSGLKSFSVYGSENTTEWFLVLATTTDFANNGTEKIATTTPESGYRYFRIWFPNTWRPSNQTWLEEIEFFECVSGCGQGETGSSSLLMSTSTDAFVGFTFQLIGWFLILGFVFLCAWATYKVIKK